MVEQDINKGKSDVTEEALQNEVINEKDATEIKKQTVISSEEDSTDEQTEEQTFDALQTELEKAQSDLNEAKEQVLRAYADVQNAKRRAQKDVEKAHKFALDKFVESLLPVIDSLERGLAIESTEENADVMKEGMELTLKLFLDTLKKFNVEQLCPEGEPFNPEHHQAMSQVDSPESEPGSVINVFQKGYTLNGRLVRPAMVIVAK